MLPDKKSMINGHKIEQYYWARKNVVYIDNRKTNETYQQACDRLANPPLHSDAEGRRR